MISRKILITSFLQPITKVGEVLNQHRLPQKWVPLPATCYQAHFSSNCWPNIPFEGLVKMVCCTIGMAGEFATAFKGGKFVHMGNTQHMAMFFFFGFNGLVDTLTFYKAPIPSGSDYASMAMAVFVKGLLFFFHLHGRSPLDIHVHQLLIVAIAVTFVAVIVEFYHRDHILSLVFRTYMTLLQGTWFIQVGFILYNPLPNSVPWEDHNHTQMMLVTTIFCAHMAINLFFILVVGYLSCRLYRSTTLSMNFDECTYKKLSTHLDQDSTEHA